MQASPRAPFSGWPIQVGGETSYGVAWYTKPAAFVTQSANAHGTVAGALLVEAMIDRMLVRHSADVAAAGGLLVIHDWRTVESFDARLIHYYAERLTVRKRTAIRAITIGIHLNAMLRIAAQAIGGTIARVHGIELDFTSDMPGTLVKHNVQRPNDVMSLD